ncbi:MAG TPA: nucleoside hydrolase [Candidatus Enterocloster excrementigallinarum]|uniref:Nucleoside hydrolase n=1 Tax=Candidatus Enterocloster excrementigallinarum TaxID=2838558 RepID=A0A9D2PQ53_9FIRM|nr:nucleoside hydrolase [Candidatus Enterocloster excrementigallinarum]
MKTAFDVDTGVDDSLALLYALNKPRFEIVGIATVTGNVEADLAAENTLKILDLAGAPEIPVTLGALAPLRGRWEGRVSVIHGDNGLGNVKLPASGRKTTGKGVEEHYLELGERCQGELVLIALGPLTNIATDPEAADLVFQSGMDITAVGLDVTTKVRFKKSHMDWLDTHCKASCRAEVDYLKEAFKHYRYGNQVQNYCIDDSPLHDPLAVMCAAAPSLVHTQMRKARVECGGTYCRGMIVTDLREHPFQAEYIRFATAVDEERALGELLSAFLEEGR